MSFKTRKISVIDERGLEEKLNKSLGIKASSPVTDFKDEVCNKQTETGVRYNPSPKSIEKDEDKAFKNFSDFFEGLKKAQEPWPSCMEYESFKEPRKVTDEDIQAFADKIAREIAERDNKTAAASPTKSNPASNPSAEYEMVEHPAHYNKYDVEAIDMIERIWGKEKAADWCEITAFKYRMRMGTKPDNSMTQDIEKENWYLNKAKEIRSRI